MTLDRILRVPWLPTLVVLSLSQSLPAYAQTTPTPAPAPLEAQQQAKTKYEQGVAAYNAGRFSEAVELFLAADRMLPRAALSFNVARAYEQLKMTALALRYYRDFLRREAGPSNANAEAANARIAVLERALMDSGQQQLTVLSEPIGAGVSIDGKALGATPWTGELTPGAHQLVLTSAGYDNKPQAFELPAEHALELRVALAPVAAASSRGPASSPSKLPEAPPAPPEPAHAKGFGPWPWLTLGAGGVALLAAGGFELSRRSAEKDAETSKLPQIAYQERLDAVHSRQTTARAFAVAGGVLVGVGGVLALLDPGRRPAPRTSAALGCGPCSCLGSFAWRY